MFVFFKGTDSTKAYDLVGHSAYAVSLMAPYQVGVVVEVSAMFLQFLTPTHLFNLSVMKKQMLAVTQYRPSPLPPSPLPPPSLQSRSRQAGTFAHVT